MFLLNLFEAIKSNLNLIRNSNLVRKSGGKIYKFPFAKVCSNCLTQMRQTIKIVMLKISKNMYFIDNDHKNAFDPMRGKKYFFLILPRTQYSCIRLFCIWGHYKAYPRIARKLKARYLVLMNYFLSNSSTPVT